jgi:general secretion pathway protein A
MYYEFFGVQKPPFNLTPDPSFLYLIPKHCEALAGISYAILARKGFVVLTGMAGTGKTTLLTHVLQNLPTRRVRSSVILNPTLSPAEFLEAVMLDFGIEDIPSSKAQRISQLQKFLWATHRTGQVSALIIDEAHKLSLELVEEIRLLGNFESATEKLLQVALIGQRELDDLINSEHLRQFKQRIARRMTLDQLAVTEVGEYIQHRWRVAGGDAAPFSTEAIECIAEVTEGTPRLINVFCDNALSDAYADGAPRVERHHIIDVCRDLQWPAPVSRSIEAAPQTAADPHLQTAKATAQATNSSGALDGYFMTTLERYSVPRAAHPSFLTRVRNKFRSPRTETA